MADDNTDLLSQSDEAVDTDPLNKKGSKDTVNPVDTDPQNKAGSKNLVPAAQSVENDPVLKDLQGQQKSADEQLADLVKRTNQMDEQYTKETAPQIEGIKKQMAELDTRQPPVLGSITGAVQQQQGGQGAQLSNQQKVNLPALFGTVILLGAIGATVFGKHRGWGAQAGIMEGLGAMMKNYSQGRHEQARESLSMTQKLMEAQDKENRDRLALYREAIASDRLSLQQKMDVIKTAAGQFHDNRLVNEAERKDVAAVQKNINDKTNARMKYLRLMNFIGHTAGGTFFNTKDGTAYRAYVLNKSGGTLDPKSSDEAMVEANEKYPYSDFTQATEEKKAEGRARGKEKAQEPEKDASDPLGLGLK